MQTTSKISVSLIFCLVLSLVSGCGDNSTLTMTAEEQAKFEKEFAAGMNIPVEHFSKLSTEELKELIDAMGQINVPDSKGKEIRHNCIKYMISKGVDVKAKGNSNFTMLHFAPDVEIAKSLVSKGADVNAKADGGMIPITPFSTALSMGNIEVAEFLVSKGADINLKGGDDGSFTLLHVIAESGNLEAAKFLVSKGADVNAKSSDGATPLDLTKGPKPWGGMKEMAEYLESVGAKSGEDL